GELRKHGRLIEFVSSEGREAIEGCADECLHLRGETSQPIKSEKASGRRHGNNQKLEGQHPIPRKELYCRQRVVNEGRIDAEAAVAVSAVGQMLPGWI